MSKNFYLSPDVDYQNELRVTYDLIDNQKDYVFNGLKSDSRILMDRLYGEEVLDTEKMSFVEQMSLRQKGYIKQQESIFNILEQRGYNKETLIFSIKKKMEKELNNRSIKNKLNSIKTDLMNLLQYVNSIEEHKGVYILDDQDKDNIVSSLANILDAL